MAGRLSLVLALATLLLCPTPIASAAKVAEPPTAWQSTGLKEHPLVGTIWAVGQRRAVDARTLAEAIALPRFVLLGEVHDNPDHHQLQAWAVGALQSLRSARISEGAPQIAAVALEMVSSDKNEVLDKFYDRAGKARRRRSAQDFGRMLEWDKSGWPQFDTYAPIIDKALYWELTLVAASPPRERVSAVAKTGIEALGPEAAQALALHLPLETDLSAALVEEIKTGHCNLLPETAHAGMVFVQRYRDAAMADAMLQASGARGSILIAGSGHIRRDRAVPLYLIARGVPSAEIVTLMPLEVEEGRTDPEDYVPRGPDGRPAVDFIWFTPRHDRTDPCQQLREHFSRRSARDAK